ncbi:MAG: hypothetical protein PF689_14270 [Deltaproteobacteria bacterium]|jgi:DNA-binding beta-propeller fold protein YncE|nr:hypothetical protein [Deltaproteobacteria bacterium]
MILKKLPLLVLMLFLYTACAEELPGIDPPKDEFFFPTGIKLSLDKKTLFVTNGNSDLKYNGSTLMALDFEKVITRMTNPGNQANCYQDPQNFDEYICELDDDIIQTTKWLDSYAGNMVFFPAPEDSEVDYRIMVSVRGGPHLTWLDIHQDQEGKVTCLDCGKGCSTGFPNKCSKNNKITIEDGLASDPFLLKHDPVYGYIISTHLGTGDLTVVDVFSEPPGVSQLNKGIMSRVSGYSGSYGIASYTEDKPYYLVSNSFFSEIVLLTWQFSPWDNLDYLIPVKRYFLQVPMGPLESGPALRDLALSSDGKKLYVLTKTPAMLLTLDMKKGEDNIPTLEVLNQVELPINPSLLKVDNSVAGYDLVYVSNFSSGRLTVVEPQFDGVITRLNIGSGPHEFIFVDEPEFNGIISVNYGESTLSFLKFENGNYKRIGRLGKPSSISSQ